MLEACDWLALRACNHSFGVLGGTANDEEARFENRNVREAATRAVRHLDQNAEARSAYEAMLAAKHDTSSAPPAPLTSL